MEEKESKITISEFLAKNMVTIYWAVISWQFATNQGSQTLIKTANARATIAESKLEKYKSDRENAAFRLAFKYMQRGDSTFILSLDSLDVIPRTDTPK